MMGKYRYQVIDTDNDKRYTKTLEDDNFFVEDRDTVVKAYRFDMDRLFDFYREIDCSKFNKIKIMKDPGQPYIDVVLSTTRKHRLTYFGDTDSDDSDYEWLPTLQSLPSLPTLPQLEEDTSDTTTTTDSEWYPPIVTPLDRYSCDDVSTESSEEPTADGYHCHHCNRRSRYPHRRCPACGRSNRIDEMMMCRRRRR